MRCDSGRFLATCGCCLLVVDKLTPLLLTHRREIQISWYRWVPNISERHVASFSHLTKHARLKSDKFRRFKTEFPGAASFKPDSQTQVTCSWTEFSFYLGAEEIKQGVFILRGNVLLPSFSTAGTLFRGMSL